MHLRVLLVELVLHAPHGELHVVDFGVFFFGSSLVLVYFGKLVCVLRHHLLLLVEMSEAFVLFGAFAQLEGVA